MRAVVLTSVLFLGSSGCYAQSVSLQNIRLLYQKAPTEEKACKELIELLGPYTEKNNPLLLGYKASATMMMAGHVFNPFSKLSYFKRGKKMLAKAVEADSDNVELRFLRYAAQTNAPSFLGYDDHITADKTFLLQSIDQLTDAALKRLVKAELKIE